MNYKNNFLIVLAILLGALMLISAASAADADIAVSDAPSIDQVTINQNEVTYNDSSTKSLNAVPTGDISVNAGTYNTDISASTSYVKNSDGTYNATIDISLSFYMKSIVSYLYPTKTVTVTVNGESHDCTINKGKNLQPSTATCTISGLVPGDYPVTIAYSGDSNFAAKTVNYTLPQVTLSITGVDSTIYDDEVTVIVRASSDSTVRGIISFSINGGVTWFNDTLSSGYASHKFTDLSKGDYTVLVKYDGANNFPAEANKTFKVDRYSAPDLTITVDSVIWDDKVTPVVKATIDGSDHAKGIISFSIDGVNWFNDTLSYGALSGATASHKFTGLAKGDYTLLVKYIGGNCEPAEANTTFKVDRKDPQVTVTGLNDTYYLDENLSVSAIINALIGEKEDDTPRTNVSFRIDNGEWFSYKVEYKTQWKLGGDVITNAYANFSTAIAGLTVGDHNLTVRYDGTNVFDTYESTFAFTVELRDPNMVVSEIPGSIVLGENLTVNVTLDSKATGTVTFIFDGVEYNRTVSQGKANYTFDSSLLTKGNHNITVVYSGDSVYDNATTVMKTFKVVGKSSETNITLDKEEVVYDDSVIVTATVTDGATGTVTLLVNGADWETKNLTGNTCVFNLSLDAGKYNITARYNGDDTFADSESSIKLLTVNKTEINNITIDVTPLETTTDGTITVTATVIFDGEEYVNGAADGNVSVLVNGRVIDTKDLDDSNSVVFNVTDLSRGLNNITVRFNGNTNYNSKESEKVSVNALRQPTITIEVDPSLLIEDLFTITAKAEGRLFDHPTGKVSFSIDGGVTWYNETFDFKVLSGSSEASHIFTNVTKGNHTVLVKYFGDSDYDPVEANTTFENAKYDTYMTVIIADIDSKPLDKDVLVGSNAYALVNILHLRGITPASGNISYSFDNETWNTAPLLLNGVLIPLKDLKVGNYTLYVEYPGDARYNGCNNSVEFNIIKRDAVWVTTVSPLNLDSILDIPLSDILNGSLGKDIVEIIIKNVLNRTLEYGDIPVVTVIDTDPALLLGAPAPTGTISFSLDGNRWYTEKVLDLVNVPTASHIFALLGLDQLVLDAGNYTVYINYSGDENYNAYNTTKDFTINRANPDISISMTPESIIPTEGALFTATLDGSKLTQIKNPKGNVSFSIDGGEWIDENLISLLINSYSAHTFTNISEGNHTVTIRYNGDNNYNVVYANKTFEVNRAIPTLEIDVDDVTIGPNVDVRATLDDSKLLYEPTGNVSFKVDDGDWVTVPLTKIILDPHADYTFTGLSVGNHTVFVRYNGDVHFAPIEANKTFEVTKITPTLNIDVDNITYGEDATVIVSLDDSYLLYEPTGNVSFKLGENGEWITVPLTKIIVLNPFASHTYEDLAAGDYTVYVKYNGDDYFFPVEDSAKFTVERANPKLSIETENIVYGNNATIVATLPNNAEGTVTFILSNGDNVTVPVINGSAIAVFEGLGAKRYNVKAIYSGDNNYTNASVSDDFEVYKAIPDVSANVSDIHYRENATVVVTVPSDATGIVYATVDGKNWYNATINNGKANIIIPGLTGGNYTAFVFYSGDDNYTWAFTSDEFKVIRINPDINVSVNDITYGEDATVVVTMANDATGNLTIALSNGMNKTVEIINGTANATFSGLGADYYFVDVYYPGDNNYWGMTVGTGFNVSQADPNISVAVDNITYGNNVTVVVTVPSDATGTVTVVLDNGMNQTVDVVNGTATAVFEDLGAGDYIVSVTYSGDQNYTGDDTTTVFTVEQATPDVTISVDNVTYGDDATVVVTVTGVDGNPVTGNVTFFFDTEEITVELDENGTASYTFSGLGAGTYDGNVRYNGNDNYTYVLDQ
ncbi:MAG: Ig-like domain-containing protein, partial [archaeon]|nr:Ig-like domain-containing protein [archaeon]